MSDTTATTETGGAGSKEQVLADLASERERRKQAEEALVKAEKSLTEAQENYQKQVAELTEKAAAAEKSASEAAAKADRLQVLREKSVPTELDDFITGSTTDEVIASADKALAVFQASKPADTTGAVKPLGMQPDGTQGASEVALNGDALEQGLRDALNI